jgi:hypothetical protein
MVGLVDQKLLVKLMLSCLTNPPQSNSRGMNKWMNTTKKTPEGNLGMKAENIKVGLPVQVKRNATQALSHYVGQHGEIESLGSGEKVAFVFVQFEPHKRSVIAHISELKKLKP